MEEGENTGSGSASDGCPICLLIIIIIIIIIIITIIRSLP